MAVLPAYRRNGIAPMLVETAVAEARKRGAGEFTAWVQVPHRQFFIRLNWRDTGRRKTICGREHLLMKAF